MCRSSSVTSLQSYLGRFVPSITKPVFLCPCSPFKLKMWPIFSVSQLSLGTGISTEATPSHLRLFRSFSWKLVSLRIAHSLTLNLNLRSLILPCSLHGGNSHKALHSSPLIILFSLQFLFIKLGAGDYQQEASPCLRLSCRAALA